MCTLFIANRVRPDNPFILLANRDEFYERPTRPAHFWPDVPHLLAGRDETSGGTWLGITTDGRFAALTNYRDPATFRQDAVSRGGLVRHYLEDRADPEAYLMQVSQEHERYNGFNLLLGDPNSLFYYNSVQDQIEPLGAGIYGLSNAFLDTPWPKVEQGRQRFENLIRRSGPLDRDALFTMMLDQTKAPDDQLPDTGLDLDMERLVSSVFIASETYGTRVITLFTVDTSGRMSFAERTYRTGGVYNGSVSYEFALPVPTQH